MDYLPPPLDLQRFPLLVQIHLQNTGFCRFDRELIGRFLGHILDQVDSMPGNEYWLNDNGDGLSFLFWRPETQMLPTEQLRNASWYHVMNGIRDQRDHILCASFTATDLVSAGRLLSGWDLQHQHYSVWNICRMMEPYRLGTGAAYPHMCYANHTVDVLRFMQDYGIQRALPNEEEDSFPCRLPVPFHRRHRIDSRISEVVAIGTLAEALSFLHLRPIATYVIVFPELFLPGNRVYTGPTSRQSRFGGYHAVSIMAVGNRNGATVAHCRLSNGPSVGINGYVFVSLDVLYVIAGAPFDTRINPTPTPTHLLTHFSMINFYEKPEERPQIKRDEKEDEEEKEDRKRQRQEKAGKGEKDRKRQRQEKAAKGYSQSNVVLQLDNIQKMVVGVMSKDRDVQVEATAGSRKLLSIERSLPITEVVQSGVVPCLVQFLSRDDFTQLQFEAAWALTNIASGTSEETNVIIDSGATAISLFAKLLSSSSEEVREQAVLALGNVAGDSPKCLEHVLSCEAMMPLLGQFNEHSKLSILRNAAWTLSNFCRGKPQPAFEQTTPVLPVLEGLLHSSDEEVLTVALWALSYLSDGKNKERQIVIDSGVIPRLVQLLDHPSPSVLIPALPTIGNIVTGDDMQTQAVISSHALPGLLNIFKNTYMKSIKKETCWAISNITAGNTSQIEEVIQAGIMQPLFDLLQRGEFQIEKEALLAISNATSGGNHDQINIKPLCDLLTCPDPRIVTVTLEGLENILKVGEAEQNLGNTGNDNLYAQMIEEVEGVEKIENLQSHDNAEIYEKAVKILESYWAEEEEEDEIGGAAALQSGNAPTGGFGLCRIKIF